MKPHHLVLATLVLMLVCFGYGCAGMWSATKKATPAVLGGVAGGLVGGPVGAGIGAGAGSVMGDAVVENGDLRSGDLVGADALTREIQRQAVVIASLRGDVQGTKAALNNLEGKSADEEHKTHWLTWLAVLALVLVVLKWWRTILADMNKAKTLGLPVLQSVIKGADSVIRKQVASP